MTWTKLGAEWPDEARHLSNAAYRLHVDALCYSNRLLSDLLIAKPEVRRFSWLPGPDATETALKELVESGWWEDRGSDWYIGAKFAGWQRTKDQVEAKRSTDTKAQRRKRLHDSGDHSECLRNCPDLSAHDKATDNATDNATESASFSERNGTAEIEVSTPERQEPRKTTAARPAPSAALPVTEPRSVSDQVTQMGWRDVPVAVPGGCPNCGDPMLRGEHCPCDPLSAIA